jgi:hypothetical protein
MARWLQERVCTRAVSVLLSQSKFSAEVLRAERNGRVGESKAAKEGGLVIRKPAAIIYHALSSLCEAVDRRRGLEPFSAATRPSPVANPECRS